MLYHVRERLKELRANETGPFVFSERGQFRVCLVYPNTYHVGMSNLGLQITHSRLNQVRGLTCERAFLPDPDLDRRFPDRQAPILSVETQRPLDEYHVVAFSISSEMDYINVVRILLRSGIPPLKTDRARPGPLVMAGGAAVTANPAPLSDIVDLVWIGEGEDGLDAVFSGLEACWGSPSVIQEVSKLPHVFVPGVNQFRDVYESASHCELNRHPVSSRILTPHTVFASTGLIEVTRGCRRACRFCLARALYGPVRSLSRPVLASRVSELEPFTKKLGLFGPGIGDYEGLSDLVDQLAQLGFAVSVSSIRLGALDSPLLGALARAGQRTVTVAPESFSPRILKYLGKSVDPTSTQDGLTRLAKSGFARVKLYLMLGIPDEDESDLASIRQALMPHIRSGQIRWDLSFSILLPRPHTPLEALPLAAKSDLEARLRFLRRDLGSIERVELVLPSVRDTYLSDFLCRGDESVGREIVAQLGTLRKPSLQLPYARYLEAMERILGQGPLPWQRS